METKIAVWEKRNLGVDTIIFYVDETDTAKNVMEQLKKCDKEYQEIVISDANTDVLLAVQEYDFHVIEMGIQMSRSVGQVKLPGVYARFEPHISYSYANEEEILYVLSRIQSGEMFITDKIARDPYFGRQKAGQRYAFWVQDVIKNGADLILAEYKNQIIGFSIWENKGNDIYNGILGGVFPEFSGKGLGFIPLYVVLCALQEKKARKAIGHVSSNNISVLKFHEMLGFSIDRMDYVLVKHQKCFDGGKF